MHVVPRTLALALAIACSVSTHAAVSPDALLVVDQHRDAIVERTIAAWPGGLTAQRAETVRRTLWGMRADRLLAASLAPGVDGLLDVLATADRAETTTRDGRVHAKALGSSTADLVYTPLTPCRIADTRAALGALAPNTTRTLLGFHASTFASQGGTATSCGIPNGVAALAMNVYAVNPSALGFIKLWASNQTEPAVSTVNYEPPTVAIATGAIVPVNTADNNKFNAESPASVHLVVDVVGYFRSVTAPGDGLRIVQASNGPFGASLNVVSGVAGNEAARNCANPILCVGTEPVVGATVSGGGSNSLGPNRVTDSFGTIGGGAGNLAGDDNADGLDASFATVAGGSDNEARATQSTVGGGRANVASGTNSVVGGGFDNAASGANSVIGGGLENVAGGAASFVGGGWQNVTVGEYSVVPGGVGNLAQGAGSFAAGRNAEALLNGCFVWSDSSSSSDPTQCGVGNAFVARAKGGFYMITGGTFAGGYTGAYLAPGSASWTTISDRASKENVAAVDTSEILARLVSIPIATWNWKSQAVAIRHMGPMAQDFRAAFGLGESEVGISTVDADGVALAAIQGLNAKLAASDAQKEREIEALKEAVARLTEEVRRLVAR